MRGQPVAVVVDPVAYFLSDRDDTRSNFYLEDAATASQTQGRELDWVYVTWDADLRFTGDHWIRRLGIPTID